MENEVTGTHLLSLLPWYVNGTLSAAEREQVEAHIATCVLCKEETEALRKLREGIKAVESQGQTPGELGLARLKHHIHAENAAHPARRWLMPALAAAAIIIVAQAGLMLNMDATHRQHMQLMSGPTKADIQVRLLPTARAEQIASLLQSIHGHIVDGPGALGIYHVRIETGVSGRKASETDIKNVVQQLRARNDVVQFVAGEHP